MIDLVDVKMKLSAIGREDMAIFVDAEFSRLEKRLSDISDLAESYDEHGAVGPRKPFSWETVARLALDYARSVVTPTANVTGTPERSVGGSELT